MRKLFCKAAATIAAVALSTALVVGVPFAYADAGSLTVGATTAVTISEGGERPEYTFEADQAGYYTFESSSDFDTYVQICDGDEILKFNDDSGAGYNFKATVYLTAGQVVTVRPYLLSDSETGSFDVTVTYSEEDLSYLDLSGYYYTNNTAVFVDGKLVISNKFQLYRDDMEFDSETGYYVGALRLNQDFVFGYFENEQGVQLSMDQVTEPGNYTGHLVASEGTSFISSKDVSFSIYDSRDFKHATCSEDEHVYIFNGILHKGSCAFSTLDEYGDEIQLVEGVDYLADDQLYQYVDLDGNDELKPIEGIPEDESWVYRRYYTEDDGRNSVDVYCDFWVYDYDKLSKWYCDSTYATATIGSNGFVVNQNFSIYYSYGDESAKLTLADGLKIVGFKPVRDDDDDSEEGDTEYIEGEPTTAGEWFMFVKAAEGSCYHGTKRVYIQVDFANSIRSMNYRFVNGACMKGGRYIAPEVYLYPYNEDSDYDDEDGNNPSVRLYVGTDLQVVEYRKYNEETGEYESRGSDEPDAIGNWMMVVEPVEGSDYSGQKEIFFDVHDADDIASWGCGYESSSDYVLTADGIKFPKLFIYSNDDDETEYRYLNSDLEIVGYRYFDGDDYVDFEGEPNAAGEWVMLVKLVDEGVYHGTKEIYFTLKDERSIDLWHFDNRNNCYVDGDTFFAPSFTAFVYGSSDDMDDRTYFVEDTDYEFAGYFTESFDYETCEWKYEPIDGSITEPGEYFAKFNALGSYVDSRYVSFYVSNFNDITYWSLRERNIVVNGDKVSIPEYRMTRRDADGKQHTIKVGEAFTVAYYEAFDEDAYDEENESYGSWVPIESFDGSYDDYRVVLEGISEKGYSGTIWEYVYVENWNDLGSWSIDMGAPYLENGSVVDLDPTVYRWASDDSKQVMDSSEYRWYFTSGPDSIDEVSAPTVSGMYYLAVVPSDTSSRKGSRVMPVSLASYNDLSAGWANTRHQGMVGITTQGVVLPVYTVHRLGDDSQVLAEGTDYTISYAKLTRPATDGEDDDYADDIVTPISGTPTEAGRYQIAFHGTGAYIGTMTRTFYMVDYTDLEAFYLEADGQVMLVDGAFAKPTFRMMWYGETTYISLIEGTDFEVYGYSKILGWDDNDEPVLGDMVDTPNEVGRYRVFVRALGTTYHGDAWGELVVSNKVRLDGADIKFRTFYEGSADFASKGFGLTYWMNNTRHDLKFGEDYVITSYRSDSTGEYLSSAPTEAGQYVAYLQAVGSKTEGTRELYFNIYADPEEFSAGDERTISASAYYGEYVGKIKADKAGRYTVTVTGSSNEVAFYDDKDLNEYHHVDESNWSTGTYSVFLEAGDTVWFWLYYGSTNYGATAHFAISYDNTCVHQYANPTYEVNAQICTATATCINCGETLQATGRTTAAVTKAASCKEAGLMTYVATFTQGFAPHSWSVEIPKSTTHSHVASVAAVAATCEKSGLTEGSRCEVCDEVVEAQEEIPALGHTPGEPVVSNEKAATCTKHGSYVSAVSCTVCQAELSRETVVTDFAAHTAGTPVVENKVAATCMAAGSCDDVVYCTECDAEISRTKRALEIDPQNHTHLVVVPGKKATTTSTGLTDGQKCDDCGVVTKTQEEIPVQTCEHVYGDAKFNEDPKDCTAELTCSECKQSITARGTVASEITKEATCSEEGVRTYTASFDPEYGISDHQWTEAISKAAHVAGEPVIENEVAATCSKEGSFDTVKYCKVCNVQMSRRSTSVDIDPEKHSEAAPVKENVVEATYEAAGSYDEVIACEYCSKELSREQKTIPALSKTALTATQVKLSATSFVYTGTARKPMVAIAGLTNGTDYTVTYSNNVNAGTAKVTVTGKGKYTGTVSKSFTIAKAANVISVKVSKKTLKYSTLKKKAQSFSIGATAKGGAKLTYKVTKKASTKIAVSRTGKVTLKKGAKKGKYVVTVTAAATGNYNKATKKITITVK